MSVAQLQEAAKALGPLTGRVVFLGGATIELWVTDPAARKPRVTLDVDVVAKVGSLAEYESFQAQLRGRGFREDVESGVMIRWRHRETGAILDAVPLAARLSGFADPWLAPATEAAVERSLPSGVALRAVPPAWLLVLKLQAFLERGGDDCLASRDFEDVVLLIDGREELHDEVLAIPDAPRRFVSTQLARVMALPTFDYGIEGAIGGVEGQARAAAVALPRFAALVDAIQSS